jgi:hypothetical protein
VGEVHDAEDAEDHREAEGGQGVEPSGREACRVYWMNALMRFLDLLVSAPPWDGVPDAPGIRHHRHAWRGSGHILQASDTGPKASAAGIVVRISS